MKKISLLLLSLIQISVAFADGPINTVTQQLAYTITCRGTSEQGLGALCPGDPDGGDGWGRIVFENDPSIIKYPIFILPNADSTQYANLFGSLQALDSIARVDHPHQDPVTSGLAYVNGYFERNAQDGHTVFIVTQINIIPKPQN